MAPPSGVIVEAPSEETMASGTPLLPFEVNGSAIALNNPADQVYIYTPATIVSGGITSEPDVTVTISSLTGVLTGGPAGSTGDGTDFLSFSITASGLGIVYPVEFQGLTLTEPGNVTADQLVITVADGIDPVVTRRIAIEVLPVPDLVLPGTISAIAGEVMQLTGLSITDPDATNLASTWSRVPRTRRTTATPATPSSRHSISARWRRGWTPSMSAPSIRSPAAR